MSLRAAALAFGGEAIYISLREIASGKKQERPRNDIILSGSEKTYIFTNPKGIFGFNQKEN